MTVLLLCFGVSFPLDDSVPSYLMRTLVILSPFYLSDPRFQIEPHYGATLMLEDFNIQILKGHN